MNQIVFRSEFAKLIWGNDKYFKPGIHKESFTPQISYMLNRTSLILSAVLKSIKQISKLSVLFECREEVVPNGVYYINL